MKRNALLIALLVAPAVLATQTLSEIENNTLRVRPFSLHQVRLLDGPFLHAQDLNSKALLNYEPDRFLANFRSAAGLEPKAPHYEGWEAMGVAGHCLGHYLSACSLMYASTGDPRFKDRVDYIVDELARCQDTFGDGFVMAVPRGHELFDEIAKGKIESQRFNLNGCWVPMYTLHKEFAGLIDAYNQCGNKKALEVASKLADWLGHTVKDLNDDQMQKIMYAEHGGINESLASLAALTGITEYLDLARKFHHTEVLDPMIEGKDVLPGMHANTQVPKIIGLGRIYELTADQPHRIGSEFFWDRVVNHHSYVTGGHCLEEHFGQPDQLNDRLGVNTTETCNVYNMLKLTDHLYEWQPRVEVADFYERALYNHILASQHPVDGRVIYNLTLEMGGYKHYQDPFSFTCCVGSGMENHSKYGDSIYFHNDDSLFVNLMIASRLDWKEKGIQITQQTRFPDSDSTRLVFTCQQPTPFKLVLRYPYWAEQGMTVTINGQPQTITSTPGSFVVLDRTWKTGDTVEATWPMSIRIETMPDNPNRIAFMVGPLVLAGLLGEINDPAAQMPEFVPVLLPGDKPVSQWLTPIAGQSNTFRLNGIGRPRDVTLVPFYTIYDQRYTLFWDIFSEADWSKRQAEYQARQREILALQARTVDLVQPGEQQPEVNHNFQHDGSSAGIGPQGRMWRHAPNGGWFSYDLKVAPVLAQTLRLTFWGEDRDRTFDVMIDQHKLTTIKLEGAHPGAYFEVDFPIPADWIKNKQTVTVKFKGLPGQTAGGLFGLRILKPE